MASTKCVGPAHPGEDDSEARRDLLGGSSSNTPSLGQSQAPPDNRGEDDLTYFVRRPSLLERVRFAFADEFAIEPAFVTIQIQRNPDGFPQRKARRRLHFCEGGTA